MGSWFILLLSVIKLATECPSSNIEKLITCQRSSGNEITFLTDVARDSQAKTMFVLEDYSFESFFFNLMMIIYIWWWWLWWWCGRFSLWEGQRWRRCAAPPRCRSTRPVMIYFQKLWFCLFSMGWWWFAFISRTVSETEILEFLNCLLLELISLICVPMRNMIHKMNT